MPFTGNRWTSNKVFSYHEMLELLKRSMIIKLQDEKHDTAKGFRCQVIKELCSDQYYGENFAAPATE
jgi:hypothetical protein